MKKISKFTLLLLSTLLFFTGISTTRLSYGATGTGTFIVDQKDQKGPIPNAYKNVITDEIYNDCWSKMTNETRLGDYNKFFFWSIETEDGVYTPASKSSNSPVDFAKYAGKKLHHYMLYRTARKNGQNISYNHVTMTIPSGDAHSYATWKNDNGYLTHGNTETKFYNIIQFDLNGQAIDYTQYNRIQINNPYHDSFNIAHYAETIPVLPDGYKDTYFAMGGETLGSSTNYAFGYAGFSMLVSPDPKVTSHFHYVDAINYRHMNKLGIIDKVEERSKVGNPERKYYAPQPQYPVMVKDIAD